jgi:transcriptional regulator with XRE-family HTH domain
MAKFAKVIQRARRGLNYLIESAILDFTIDLDELLKHKSLTRARLARKLGTSDAYVSQVLSGQRNLTIKTMATFAHALDCRLRIQLEPIQSAKQEEVWHRIDEESLDARFALADSLQEAYSSIAKNVTGER